MHRITRVMATTYIQITIIPNPVRLTHTEAKVIPVGVAPAAHTVRIR